MSSVQKWVFGRALTIVSLMIGTHGLARAEMGSPSGPAINRDCALSIGSFHVSQYLVEKYYKRFAAGFVQQMHRGPTAGESGEWFSGFVAKQVITARAESLGYFLRPEVVDIVNRMERNMLSSSSGPFYQFLRSAEPESATFHAKARDRSSHQRDGIVAEFPDGAAASIWLRLGADFETCSVGEQRRRILDCQGYEGVRVLDGPLSWPCQPFVEAADAVADAPVGRWTIHREPWFGVYYIFIRKDGDGPTGLATSNEESMEAYETMVHDATMAQRRRNELLVSAAFTIEEETASRLADALAAIENRGEIPSDAISKFGGAALSRCRIGGNSVVVSVEDFRRHFNGLFVKQLPRDVTEVRRGAEDMVMEELDVREAREMGIDRTPEFEENRKGFTGFQALDLFEKERIAPTLSIAPQQVEAYYSAHPADFSRTSSVRGRVLEFATSEKATQWMRSKRSQPNPDPIGPDSPARDVSVELARGETIPGLESLHDIPQDCPDGTIIGPLRRGTAYALFLKEATLTRIWVPLDTAISTIRPILMRQLLDAQEVAYAADLLKTQRIEDHIDYPRYGLAAADAPFRSTL